LQLRQGHLVLQHHGRLEPASRRPALREHEHGNTNISCCRFHERSRVTAARTSCATVSRTPALRAHEFLCCGSTEVWSKYISGQHPNDASSSSSNLTVIINVLAHLAVASYYIDFRKIFQMLYPEHMHADIAVDLAFPPFNFSIIASFNYTLGG
jgi:hypothetical protein